MAEDDVPLHFLKHLKDNVVLCCATMVTHPRMMLISFI